MMNAPLRPGTRPVGAAQLAVKDTSTNGPVFTATPKGDGPRPQDRRGGVYLLTGDQGDQGRPGRAVVVRAWPGHRNIGRGACRSALADGVERRSTAVVLG